MQDWIFLEVAAHREGYIGKDRLNMNQNELRKLAEDLGNLNESELIYVLSKFLSKHNPYKDDPVIEKSRFVLGIAYLEEGNSRLDIVAYPDPDKYGDDLGPDWGLCQRSGSSDWDGIEYVSNVKQGIPPYTDEKIYMT